MTIETTVEDGVVPPPGNPVDLAVEFYGKYDAVEVGHKLKKTAATSAGTAEAPLADRSLYFRRHQGSQGWK